MQGIHFSAEILLYPEPCTVLYPAPGHILELKPQAISIKVSEGEWEPNVDKGWLQSLSHLKAHI